MGRARFFCACGKEIWQDMKREDREFLTIAAAEDGCKCAECFLREWRSATAHRDQTEALAKPIAKSEEVKDES